MDSENLTITLPRQDWQLIQVALGELQAKFAIPVMGRLQAALAEAERVSKEGLVLTPLPKEAAE